MQPSTSRPRSSTSAAVGFALAAALPAALLAPPALAQDTHPDTLGTNLVGEFIDILSQDDEAKRAGLEGFLAEEFQIVRSNGVRLDKAGYLENPSTVIEAAISDVRATMSGDVLVVSYVLSVDVILDGVETETLAPRLSVFHLGPDGRWRIASHANFGALEGDASR